MSTASLRMVLTALGLSLVPGLSGLAFSATLKEVRGSVLVSSPTGLRSAAPGSALPPGTRILTTANASATITVGPGCEINLTGNQRLTIAPFPSCQAAKSAVEGVSAQLAASAQVLPAVQIARPTASFTLSASALFPHDTANAAQMLDSGRSEIDRFLQRMERECRGVERMVIEGHADITNSTGDATYNERLSLARAVAVRDYIGGKVDKNVKLEAIGFGHKVPVKTSCVYPKGSKLTPGGLVRGSASAADMQALYDCLQPNRRVVVRVEGSGLVCGVPPVASTPQPAAVPPPPPAVPATPPVAAAPVPPPAAPPVAPPAPPVAPPPPAVVAAPAASGNPAAILLGGAGVVGLGYYLYDRDRRNTSPN